MITVNEADQLLAQNLVRLSAQKIPLMMAKNCILNEEVVSERDQPPFHRMAMDGIALRFSDFEKGQKVFQIIGMQKAGQEQLTLEGENTCMEVMTGGVLPKNADCVVRYEDIEIKEGQAEIKIELEFMQNVHQQGSDHKQGQVLLKPGQKLTSPRLGIAAANGYAHIKIKSKPRIALISTGDELVDFGHDPLPHQIRRSNSYSLSAELMSFGFTDIQDFHLIDDEQKIHQSLKAILETFDVLILSGGVSMGKFDFIPKVLADLKIKKVFHKISQRPGKPFWYGISEKGQGVFALPGNPVSCLVCLRRYVLPNLFKAQSVHSEEAVVSPVYAELSDDFKFAKDLTYFLPVKVYSDNGGRLIAQPRPTNGSGDYGSLADSDGFVELPKEKSRFSAGESYKYFSWGHE